MKSAAHGIATSDLEVTNISKHGIWLLLGEHELFMPFAHFPWFVDAPIAKILHVRQLSENHLYWPDLDIDLTVDSIRQPDRYPLVSKRESPS